MIWARCAFLTLIRLRQLGVGLRFLASELLEVACNFFRGLLMLLVGTPAVVLARVRSLVLRLFHI